MGDVYLLGGPDFNGPRISIPDTKQEKADYWVEKMLFELSMKGTKDE